MSQPEHQGSSCPHFQESHTDQATQLSHMYRGPRLVPRRLAGCWFRLWVPMSQASHFCEFSSDVHDSPVTYILSSFSSAGLLALDITTKG